MKKRNTSKIDSATVNLNPGLRSYTAVNRFRPNSAITPTCFVQCGSFCPTGDTSWSEAGGAQNYVNSMFFERIAEQWYLTVASNVNYRATIDNGALEKFMALIVDGLEIYYMVDSLATYRPVGVEMNEGLIALQEKYITPQVLELHKRIHDRIIGMPLPPNLLQVVRWLYQNYRQGEVHSSTVIRNSYKTCLIDKYDIATAQQTWLTSMQESTFRELNAMLRRARPEWLVQSLPPSSDKIIFDKKFNAFWMNSGWGYSINEATQRVIPFVTSPTTGLFYQSNFEPDELDGLIYALTCINYQNGENTSQELGLWAHSFLNHKGDKYTSVCVINADGSADSISDGSQNKYNCMKTYNGESAAAVHYIAGTQELLNHNIENVKAAVNDAVDWLWSLSELRIVKKNKIQ